jgi:hypothetical protein
MGDANDGETLFLVLLIEWDEVFAVLSAGAAP